MHSWHLDMLELARRAKPGGQAMLELARMAQTEEYFSDRLVQFPQQTHTGTLSYGHFNKLATLAIPKPFLCNLLSIRMQFAAGK